VDDKKVYYTTAELNQPADPAHSCKQNIITTTHRHIVEERSGEGSPMEAGTGNSRRSEQQCEQRNQLARKKNGGKSGCCERNSSSWASLLTHLIARVLHAMACSDGKMAKWCSLVCLSGIGDGPAANGIVATNVVSYCGAACNVNLKKKLRDVIMYIVD